MKVATFNINNVKKRLANLVDWLREERPDVVCLQELKATDSEFPIAAVEQAGYGDLSPCSTKSDGEETSDGHERARQHGCGTFS
jgi:exonuclease III